VRPGRSERRCERRASSKEASAGSCCSGRPCRCWRAHPPSSSTRRRARSSEQRFAGRGGAPRLATICGAAALAARAETELLATGARPRRVALSGVESLTPSERRVAELAAAGPTNREIAQELFVTQRTVEVHLTSVYRKLGIDSRSQLSAALGEAASV
jgi:DNA-binding CsgD family transcriptional regulator